MKSIFMHAHIAVIIALTVIFLPSSSYAGRIAVVARSRIIPYEQFVEGYMKAYRESSESRDRCDVFYLSPDKSDSERTARQNIHLYNPDIIIAVGSAALHFTRYYFSQLPVVYSMVLNPYAESASDDSGCLGISMSVSVEEKLKVLKHIKNGITTIGTVYDPDETHVQVQEARNSANRYGYDFVAVPVSSPKEVIPAIDDVMSRADVYMLFFDRTVLSMQSLEHLFTCSFRRSVPVIGLSEKYVQRGALFSLDYDVAMLGKETWRYTVLCMENPDQCSGVKKVSFPVHLNVNRKIADKMNLILPEKLIDESWMRTQQALYAHLKLLFYICFG